MTKTAGDWVVIAHCFERVFWDTLIGKKVTLSVLIGTELLAARLL